MKRSRLFLSGLLAPVVVATPAVLSSCSVYSDMLKPFVPSYSKLEKQQLTKEQATNKWWEKVKTVGDFVKQEFHWSNYIGTKDKEIGATWVTGVSYERSIIKNQCIINYVDQTKADNQQLSFKSKSIITLQDDYIYKNEKVGYGKSNYDIEIEMKNLKYDVEKEVATTVGKETHLFIKPEKFIWNNDTSSWEWNQYLENDESISFNIRVINEAYNVDGIQVYENETQEAAGLDKTHSFLPELSYAIDYLVGFWSYYLEDCELID